MKQHITVKQLEELSKREKEKLRKWWVDHIQEGDLYIDLDDVTMPEMIRCCEHELEYESEMPLLSIGQMIEFLDERNDFDEIIKDKDRWEFHTTMKPTGKCFLDKELCDALWEAVKEVLEK